MEADKGDYSDRRYFVDVSTMDEKLKEIVRRFLQELPATSDGRIGRIVGCDAQVVSQVRRELLGAGEIQMREAPGDWRTKIIKKSQ